MDKDIETALITLAEKLGVATDRLWNVLIDQVVLAGFLNATEALVYLALCATAGIWLKRKWKEWGEPDFLLILLGVVSLFVSAYAAHSFKFLVTVVLSPEYAALIMLADLFNK